LIFAFFEGNPAGGLIYKAWRPVEPRCQQSYPQNIWMAAKALENQQLK
jgi:hypothetical protein